MLTPVTREELARLVAERGEGVLAAVSADGAQIDIGHPAFVRAAATARAPGIVARRLDPLTGARLKLGRIPILAGTALRARREEACNACPRRQEEEVAGRRVRFCSGKTCGENRDISSAIGRLDGRAAGFCPRAAWPMEALRGEG